MFNITGMCPAFPGFKAIYVVDPATQEESERLEDKCHIEFPIALFAAINFADIKPVIVDDLGRIKIAPESWEGHTFFGVRAPSDADEVISDWVKREYDSRYDKWLDGIAPSADDLANSFEE